MLVQFETIHNKEQTLGDLAGQCGVSDLRETLNSYVERTVGIIGGLTDQQVILIPYDPAADDPYAASKEERHVGWSLAHVVLHVTASAEEAAAFSSILARGIAIGGRLRHECDWRQITKTAELVSRLEECRRICLAYLSTWPDEPDLETTRVMPENISWMKANAPLCFLFGLMHWHSHMEQLQRAAALRI